MALSQPEVVKAVVDLGIDVANEVPGLEKRLKLLAARSKYTRLEFELHNRELGYGEPGCRGKSLEFTIKLAATMVGPLPTAYGADDAIAVVEAVRGRDLVSGEHLDPTARGIRIAAAALPFPEVIVENALTLARHTAENRLAPEITEAEVRKDYPHFYQMRDLAGNLGMGGVKKVSILEVIKFLKRDLEIQDLLEKKGPSWGDKLRTWGLGFQQDSLLAPETDKLVKARQLQNGVLVLAFLGTALGMTATYGAILDLPEKVATIWPSVQHGRFIEAFGPTIEQIKIIGGTGIKTALEFGAFLAAGKMDTRKITQKSTLINPAFGAIISAMGKMVGS